jgi:hypothetical protein
MSAFLKLLGVLLIASALVLFAAVYSVPKKSQATFTLSCGSAYDQFPFVDEVLFILPPLNCWTSWQVRPTQASKFWWTPSASVEWQMSFEDGSVQTGTTTPLDVTKYERKITGVRFRNTSKETIRVTLEL